MATARDFIRSVLRLIQAVRKNESVAADEAVDALAALNELLGSWSNDSLKILNREREFFNITSGSSYTIGLGASLNTVRPIKIIDAFVRIGDIDFPLTEIDDTEYSNIGFKGIESNIPQFFNYDNAYPTGTIRIFPKLTGNAELHIISEKPLSEVANLNSTLDLAPGVKRALKYNLAIDIAPEYNRPISDDIRRIAKNSKRKLQNNIARHRPIKQRAHNNNLHNIYSGWYF